MKLKYFSTWLLASLLIISMQSVKANQQASNAIDIAFVDLKGEEVRLSDFRGKWVVVNFWATWCPPCLAEIPELVLFHEAHHRKDAVVLGVNYENGPIDKVQKFADEQMVNFPVIRLANKIDGRTTPFGPLKGLPSTYMISPAGEVIAARTGMVDQALLEAFLAKMTEQK